MKTALGIRQATGTNRLLSQLTRTAAGMRSIVLVGVTALFVASLQTPVVLADPLFSAGSFFRGLYGDQKAREPGDILHIVIAERTTATHSASRALKRDADTEVGPGKGWLDFIKMIGFQGAHKSADRATSVRTGSITARVAVRVVEKLPNGNLLVEGEHVVRVNKDVQRISIRGEVRPRDIRGDNTVFSYDVANLQIEYHGSDPGKPGGRTGIITRILNLLF